MNKLSETILQPDLCLYKYRLRSVEIPYNTSRKRIGRLNETKINVIKDIPRTKA